MQILYLSNRPSVVSDTLRLVRRLMPWVGQAVIVAPGSTIERFDTGDLGDVLLLSDEAVTGLSSTDLAGLDHVRRNVTLRRALISGENLDSDVVDDVFLLSDDDYRPLRELDRSFFISESGDRGYYCYDLALWPGDETPFDEAQHTTREALSLLGGAQLSFGSHMPQIMRRKIWLDAFEQFDRLTDDAMVCEWTLYFNLGMERYPETFDDAQPFQTMCWPQYPNEWPSWVSPRHFSFENHYPELYESGHLFAGLEAAPRAGAELSQSYSKLRRWSAFGRQSARLDFSGGVANPWTGDSTMRRGTFGVLKQIRKAYDYVSLEEHAAITELSGDVARLAEEIRRRDIP